MIHPCLLRAVLIVCMSVGMAAGQTVAAPTATSPADGGNTVVIRWPDGKTDGKPMPPVRFTARFAPESLIAFLRANTGRLPLPLQPEEEQAAVVAALQHVDMGAVLQVLHDQLAGGLGDRLNLDEGLILMPVPPEHQVTIDLTDIGLPAYEGPKQQVAGLLVNGVTEQEYVAIALAIMEKARQLLATGDPAYDRTAPEHYKAIAEAEVKAIRAKHEEEIETAKRKEEARKRVGELLGVYDAKSGKFQGEPHWVKEARRFTYVVDPKTGKFIDRLQPVVERINDEMDLAGFPGPSPLDKPGIHFDPDLADVEIVLPKPMVKDFLAETDALEQRMAEKLIISIEAVRLTDRDIENGAVAARLNADLLGVHNPKYGYTEKGVLRRIGINALTAIANQQLQIQQLNNVAAGAWPAATPLVTLDPVPLPPLQQTKTWTSVGGNFAVGSDPIFFDGRQQTFGLTYVDPNGVSHTLGLDVVDSLRKFWSRIERNLIVHTIKKDPSIPPTSFTVPVGPSDTTYKGLAALISQEDQNLIVATGTGAISQISAKAGTWLIIQDFMITPVPGSSTAMTEEEIEELRLKTMLTILLRDPRTDVDDKRVLLESQNVDALRQLLNAQYEAKRTKMIRPGPRSRTYGVACEERFTEALDSANVKKKEENSVIALTFYSSQGSIVQSPGATQLGSANDLTSLTTELRPNIVTPVSSFVLKTLENTDSKSPLTGLAKGESSDESKTMAHLLVRARFPTADREKRDLDEGRQLGYFKLPLEREPLSAVNVPLLSSSEHPLERLASLRVGAMFDALQPNKIRRYLSPFEPNVLDGTVSKGTWETATTRLLLNYKIAGDAGADAATLSPQFRDRFILEVRSLLEYDPDFFDEPNVALRNMYHWNDADRIVAALNLNSERFALSRLVTMIDELGRLLVPDDYIEENLAVSEYKLLEGHRLRRLTDEEIETLRHDVANHFLRRVEAYGDAFLEAVSNILGLGSYRAMKESDLDKGPFHGYKELVLFDRGAGAQYKPGPSNQTHQRFLTLRAGGIKGELFEPSLMVLEDLHSDERGYIIRGEDIVP